MAEYVKTWDKHEMGYDRATKALAEGWTAEEAQEILGIKTTKSGQHLPFNNEISIKGMSADNKAEMEAFHSKIDLGLYQASRDYREAVQKAFLKKFYPDVPHPENENRHDFKPKRPSQRPC